MAGPQTGLPAADRGTNDRGVESKDRGATGRATRLEGALVSVRFLHDTEALAARIILVMDELERGLAGLSGSGRTVDLILFSLERDELTTDEVMDMLQRLGRAKRLGEFLNLIRNRDLRAYLEAKRVPFGFIQLHWEPSVHDSGNFFAGVVVGAGAELLEGLKMMAYLLASPLVDAFASAAARVGAIDEARARRLVADRDEFQQQLHRAFAQFFDHPIATLVQGYDALHAEYQRHLYRFEFFEAGVVFGRFLLIVLTLESAALTLWKLPGALVKIARLTAAQFLRLASAKAVLEFLRQIPPRQPLLVAGAANGSVVIAEPVAGTLAAVSSSGTPLGQIALGEALVGLRDAGVSIEEIERLADELGVPNEEPPGRRRSPRNGRSVRLPDEPVLSNANAPLADRLAFLREHLDTLRRFPERVSEQQIRNLERLLAEERPRPQSVGYYEGLVDDVLKREFIAGLNDSNLPFEVVEVNRIATRGPSVAARGGEMEAIARSARTGRPSRVSWTARSKGGTLVQMDDFDPERVVPREIKAARELYRAGDENVDAILSQEYRQFAERLERHARFARESDLPFYEWVVFSTKMQRGIDEILARLPSSIREKIRLVVEPYFE